MKARDIIDTKKVKENMKVYRAEKKAQLIDLRDRKKADMAAKKHSRQIDNLKKAYIKAGGSYADAITTCNTLTANNNESSQIV